MTDSHRAPSRHVSVWIDADAATVYGYVSNPVNLPQWAAGLADGAPRQVDGRWVVTSPMGR